MRNAPFWITLGVLVLYVRNRSLTAAGNTGIAGGLILRQDIAPGDSRQYIGTSPSPPGTEGTGNTNPLSVFGSAIHNLLWPKTTLAGNAPASPAAPAGPPGDITDNDGGTPGTPSGPPDAWAYNPQFDSPEGYFDPFTETFIPTV